MARDYDHLLDAHVLALTEDVRRLRGLVESDVESLRARLETLQQRITMLWAAVAALCGVVALLALRVLS